MTVKEGTICSLIQTFPVLLILAQNSNKCLKTPLMYKPPSPTHSPEYYEALDALVQSLYGQGNHESHGLGHGYPTVHSGYPSYGNEHHGFLDSGLSNCQYSYGNYGYGKKWYGSNSGGHGKPCYQYVYTSGTGYNTYGTGLQGYPNYGVRKGYLYSVDGNYSTSSYAPTQVYNTKNKYQVVVKKTKIGGRKRIGKSQAQTETHQPLSQIEQHNITQTGLDENNPIIAKIKTPPRKTNNNKENDSYKVHEESSFEDFSNSNYGGVPTGMPEQKTCKTGCCVPLYQCQQYLKKFQGTRPGAQVQLQTTRCGTEGIHPKVCCPQSVVPSSRSVFPKMITSPTSGILSSAMKSNPGGVPIPLPETPVFRF